MQFELRQLREVLQKEMIQARSESLLSLDFADLVLTVQAHHVPPDVIAIHCCPSTDLH